MTPEPDPSTRETSAMEPPTIALPAASPFFDDSFGPYAPLRLIGEGGLSENVPDAIAFSPDGNRTATAGSGDTAKLWDAASGRLQLTLRGHTDRVTSVRFSRDGRRVLTGSIDGSARVWDANTGRELLNIRTGQLVVWMAAFSPDGRRIATGGTDRTARIWDSGSGRELLAVRSPRGRVTSVAFNPDGSLLGTAGDDTAVNVWDAETGSLRLRIDKIPKTGAIPNTLAFSPDGKRLITAGNNPMLWDAATGRQLLTLRGHLRGIDAVAFSPDGKRIATGSEDRTAIVWDAVTGQQLFALPHDSAVADVAFSPDSRRLAVAGRGGVQIYAIAIDDLLRLARSRATRSLTPAECLNYFQSDTCPTLP